MERIRSHVKSHRVTHFVFPKCQGCQSTSLVMKSAWVPSAAGCRRFPALLWFVVIWVLPGQLAPLHNGGSGRLSPAYQCHSWSSAGLLREGKTGHRCPPLRMAGSGWALWCRGAPRRALSCIGCAEIQVLSRVRPGSRLQEVDLWCKDLRSTGGICCQRTWEHKILRCSIKGSNQEKDRNVPEINAQLFSLGVLRGF